MELEGERVSDRVSDSAEGGACFRWDLLSVGQGGPRKRSRQEHRSPELGAGCDQSGAPQGQQEDAKLLVSRAGSQWRSGWSEVWEGAEPWTQCWGLHQSQTQG